jgi:hypothetical protein
VFESITVDSDIEVNRDIKIKVDSLVSKAIKIKFVRQYQASVRNSVWAYSSVG